MITLSQFGSDLDPIDAVARGEQEHKSFTEENKKRTAARGEHQSVDDEKKDTQGMEGGRGKKEE